MPEALKRREAEPRGARGARRAAARARRAQPRLPDRRRRGAGRGDRRGPRARRRRRRGGAAAAAAEQPPGQRVHQRTGRGRRPRGLRGRWTPCPRSPASTLDDAAAQGARRPHDRDRRPSTPTTRRCCPARCCRRSALGDGEVPDRTPVDARSRRAAGVSLRRPRAGGLRPGADALRRRPNSEGVAAVACLSPAGGRRGVRARSARAWPTRCRSARASRSPSGPTRRTRRRSARSSARSSARWPRAARALRRDGAQFRDAGPGGRGRPRRLRGRRRQAAQGGREPGGREHQPAIAGRLGDAAATWKKAAAEARAKDKARLRPRGGRDPQGGAAPGPDAQGAAGRRVRALRLKVEKFTEAHAVE